MKTTKASERIAKDLRAAGYTDHEICDNGSQITVTVKHAGAFLDFDLICERDYTLTKAYKAIWKQHKENQSGA